MQCVSLGKDVDIEKYRCGWDVHAPFLCEHCMLWHDLTWTTRMHAAKIVHDINYDDVLRKFRCL
jgi:hypothetical protein